MRITSHKGMFKDKVLNKLLEIPNVFREIISYHDELKNSVSSEITIIIQTKFWKNICKNFKHDIVLL